MTSVSASSSMRDTISAIPGYDPEAGAGDCIFSEEAAQVVVDFFRECLVHVKGERAGEPFELEGWQVAVVANLFGWKRPDGTRRYREALIFVPRKNGKSLLAAGICNYMLFCDGEAGAEIYAAAADREQASLVFEVAKQQVLRQKVLRDASRVFTKAITREELGSTFKAISADAATKHGYNSSCVVIDELHAQPNRELVDVLMTSTGARRQPLMIHITTADFDRESICNEKYDYAVKVRDGIIDDPSFLPVIYEAGRDDDFTDPEVWRRANPNLGVSLSEEYLRRECQRARESAAFENTFKRLHLNVRTEQDVRWLSMDRWDACGGELDLESLRGQECYAGLDLSSTRDISALVLLFPHAQNAVLPFFWLPSDTAAERDRRDRVPYLTWARRGHIELTPGSVIDYGFIRRRVNDLSEIYRIKEVAFDPWNATQLALQLGEEDGFSMVQFRQGYISMNEPAKQLEALVLKGDLRHGGHPVLRWMASNVCVRTDPAGNIKIDKQKSTEKVDGIVALAMAVGRAMIATEHTSIYQKRGMLSI